MHSNDMRLGMCVSGGPDSMALAFLFRELQRHKMSPKLGLTALIVDHGHRPDSRQEAVTVSGWLEKLGAFIPTANVLRLIAP
jgi:tRNA(Ile)-lysidine synthase